MSVRIIDVEMLPEQPSMDVAYRIIPQNPPNQDYYRERTSRHYPWISNDEQSLLKNMTVSIAGCGGMGGLLAATMARTGLGHINVADTERFDVSNINRQMSARRNTVGLSKAIETARDVINITDDLTLTTYPMGVTEETVDQFLDGADIVLDEIEFWAIGSRILLHQRARERNIPVLNCNTVGFGTRLFMFTADDVTIESCFNLTLAEAMGLQEKMEQGEITPDEINALLIRLFMVLVPEVPDYTPDDPSYNTIHLAQTRLVTEQTVPIIAPNPIMAVGFLADRLLLELLTQMPGKFGTKWQLPSRTITPIPAAPGYLYLDAALMQAKAVCAKTSKA